MSYATTPQYLARFGADEAAQLLGADPEPLLAAAAGQPMPSGTTPEQEAAAAAALARLLRALGIAANLMDGYLRAVATLPIAADDANAGTLEECCCHLTRYSISSAPGTMTESKKDENTRWLAWLRDVSARRVQLISTGTQQQAPGAGSVRTGRAKSGYDWTAHGMGTGYQE